MAKINIYTSLLVICVAYISATEVNKCESGLPLPLKVDVSNCVKGPCELPKGKEVFMNLTFDAPHDLELFEPKIVAHALGVDVDYPMPEKNGCKQLLDAVCPLEEGQRVLFGTSMMVSSIYPNINFGIELTLYANDENGKEVGFTCFQIDGRVVG